MIQFLERLAPVWQPHDGQREFLLADAHTKVLACGRRWGKTDACAVAVLAALHRPSPTRHLILAPTLEQATLLFDRVVELLEALIAHDGGDAPIKARRGNHPELTYGQHKVLARSGFVPRSLRGHGATDIVVDEAAYLPESLVTEVAMPMLATSAGHLTMISTPFGRNHFWRFFQMGQSGEHGVWSRQAPTSKNPYVKPEFLEIQRELISDRAYAVEYEAQFDEATGKVFGTEAVQKCLVTKVGPAEGQACVGVDWARYGDYTAVAVVTGHQNQAKLVELKQWRGRDWQATVAEVAATLANYPGCITVCDATGVGDPVVDMLKTAAPRAAVEGLVFTSPTKRSLVDNLAMLIDRCALRMESDPALLRQLDRFEAKTTQAGNVKLQASGSEHDDLVVALALACSKLHKVYKPVISVGPLRQFSKSKRNNRHVEHLRTQIEQSRG